MVPSGAEGKAETGENQLDGSDAMGALTSMSPTAHLRIWSEYLGAFLHLVVTQETLASHEKVRNVVFVSENLQSD
ncbi:hypothetical protein N7517_009340 [Penicillium concentricum]|uniref:Uncharacterized protein n=1 Tax=Penicillium concentricum TaxID=293559 RepID=A0A9W9RIZ5_9EURO|nr:uncharacterized protein N7517_009340 [Penicillium concentricum]KAJ5360149.1 hypothetical protein N7517_009340 [Penicillium concentricum]